MLKRILSMILLVTLMASLTVVASAATADEVAPLYDEVRSVYAYISIDDTLGIATCTGRVTAKEVVPVKVFVRLQIFEDGTWKNVKTWTETGSYSVTSSHQYAVYRDCSYRVYVTGYVYDSEGVLQEAASVIDYP